MTGIKNKRFIAGASCPSCADIDKIYTYEMEEQKWRACAACDFKEEFSDAMNGAIKSEELVTRVNQSRIGEPTLAHETALEAVRLIDPKRKN